MSFTTKLIFKEKNLLSEILEDHFLQVVEHNKKLYFLIMSELKIDNTKPVNFEISITDRMISFFNSDCDQNKLTEKSFYEMLKEIESDQAQGNVISYEVDENELDQLIEIIKSYSEINVIHFIVEDIDEMEDLMMKESFKITEGEDFLSKISEDLQNFGVNPKSSDIFSKINNDICIENGWITPFYFIREIESLKDIKTLKTPKNINSINEFKI